MNENVGLWLLCMGVCAAIFVARSVMAWRGGEPARLLSFMEVKPEEIIDVPAYNRANGIMWLCFSGIFLVSAVIGLFSAKAAGWFTLIGVPLGCVALFVAFLRIFTRFKRHAPSEEETDHE